MARLLDLEELNLRLADLPGVHRDRLGALVLPVRAPTFPDAVRLIALVADEAEAMNHHPDVDLRWRTVIFTFSTHSAGGVTDLDLELARRVLALAATVGATRGTRQQRVEIALDCVHAYAIRPFWAAGLGYVERTGQGGVELHDPAGRGPVLWFQHMDPPRTGRGRFHLDVYLLPETAQDRLQACLSAGGRLVTDAHAPSWWVVADAEGNELCLCVQEEADPAAGA